MHTHTHKDSHTHTPTQTAPTSEVLVWHCSVVVGNHLASASSEKHHLQMAGATWMYPILPWQYLSLAGSHIHRCPHPHTCTFSSARLKQATREPQWVPEIEDQRHDVAPHTHTHTLTPTKQEVVLTLISPQKGQLRTKHTHTRLPPACNLHLGKGIFHLGVTATGQACIPTHTDAHTWTHSFAPSTCYLFSLCRHVDQPHQCTIIHTNTH